MIREIIKNSIDRIILLESFFHKKKVFATGSAGAGANEDKKRILILRKDGLGDCILFYPTLGAYREFYADADVTLILPKWFEPLGSLLDKFHFDRVIWFDHKRFARDFSYRRTFLLDLKRDGYDIALYPVFTRELIGNFMIEMTGALEIKIKVPDRIELELDRDVYFAEQITGRKIAVSFPTIDLMGLPAGKIEAEEFMKKNGLDAQQPYAIIFPGAGAAYRIWPAEHFADIIDYISRQGLTPVICGSPSEKKIAQAILSRMQTSSKAVDLSGQTDLPILAHLLSRARFYFGSDTGILHLAAALGTPAIALMGSGGYRRFFPYGDLQKNRAVYEADYIKNNPQSIGNWDDAKKLAASDIHPSIKNISVATAQKEIDYMIDFVQSGKNEKDD
jgi:ADP-heptose:LPS heptosyltransferase